MHLYKLLLFLCLPTILCKAQNFDRRYNVFNTNNYNSGILEDVTGYYISGSFVDTNNYLNTSIYLAKLDKLGNKVWAVHFSLPIKQASVAPQTLHKLNGGFLQASGYTTDTAGYHRILVLKWDTSGALVNYKEIKNPLDSTNGSMFINRTSILSDGSTIGAGNYNINGNTQIVALKLDTGYNVVWAKTFGNPSKFSPCSALSNPVNDTFFIGSCQANTSDDTRSNYKVQSYIIKVDSGGNLIWEYLTSGNNLSSMVHCIRATSDGGCIYTAAEGYEVVRGGNYSDKYWVGKLEKLNATGFSTWKTNYGNHLISYPPYGTPFGNTLQTTDGKKIIVGEVYQDSSTTYALYALKQFDSVGTLLRNRSFGISEEPDTAQWLNFGGDVFDMALVSNGGVAIAGYMIDDRQNHAALPQQTRVIVVDSNWCSGITDPYCTLGVIQPIGLSNNISVYPNPAQEYVSITTSGSETMQIVITNITGTVIEQKTAWKRLDINTALWSPGVYFYKIYSSTVPIKSGKIVVVH